MTAICRCGASLDDHNVTRMCRECKHIARAAAAGHLADEVPLDEARANFVAVFRGRYRAVTADAIYLPSACRRCGRFRGRRDTGLCEFCGRPRRWPPRGKARKNLPPARGSTPGRGVAK